MTETADPTPRVEVDLGQALGSLLRRYLDGAREAVAGMPGGPRGFQVMSLAAVSACSNQAGMAEALGLDRTVMTYLVDDLEKAGLVERQPDPADRRARQVLLTRAGTTAFEHAKERIEHVERSVLGALSDAEAGTLRELLSRVTTAGPTVARACDGSDVPTC